MVSRFLPILTSLQLSNRSPLELSHDGSMITFLGKLETVRIGHWWVCLTFSSVSTDIFASEGLPSDCVPCIRSCYSTPSNNIQMMDGDHTIVAANSRSVRRDTCRPAYQKSFVWRRDLDTDFVLRQIMKQTCRPFYTQVLSTTPSTLFIFPLLHIFTVCDSCFVYKFSSGKIHVVKIINTQY